MRVGDDFYLKEVQSKYGTENLCCDLVFPKVKPPVTVLYKKVDVITRYSCSLSTYYHSKTNLISSILFFSVHSKMKNPSFLGGQIIYPQ